MQRLRDRCRVLEGGRVALVDVKNSARSRRPFRAPGQPVEPEDAAVHLRQAEPHPHHRPARNRPRPAPGLPLPVAGRQPRQPGPVRRHQAAGQGNRRARGGRAAACRSSASAGWAAPSRTTAPSATGSSGCRNSKPCGCRPARTRPRSTCTPTSQAMMNEPGKLDLDQGPGDAPTSARYSQEDGRDAQPRADQDPPQPARASAT